MSCLVSSASVTAKFVAVKVIADVPQRRKLHARSACAGVPRNSNDAIHKECQLVRSCPISPLKRRLQDAHESLHCRRRIVFATGGRQQRIPLGPSEFTIDNTRHGYSSK